MAKQEFTEEDVKTTFGLDKEAFVPWSDKANSNPIKDINEYVKQITKLGASTAAVEKSMTYLGTAMTSATAGQVTKVNTIFPTVSAGGNPVKYTYSGSSYDVVIYDEVAPVKCPSPQSVVINTLGASFEVPIPSDASSPAK